MIKLRVGGVPEHFNLPWHLALEARRFEPLGLRIAWQDYPGGSGAMATALRDGELDAALLLTEGAIAAIAEGAPFKIASLYTDSPLVWGIHVPAVSRLRAERDQSARLGVAVDGVRARPRTRLAGRAARVRDRRQSRGRRRRVRGRRR
jgi:hypothetical protein